MKKGYLLLFFGAIPVAGLAIFSALNSSSVGETSIDNENKSLRTRNYKTDLKTFVSKAAEIMPTLTTYGRNWRLVSADIFENTAQIKAEVPVQIFTDDLEIKANTVEGKEGISVDAHSKSRIGTNDLGENKRHVLQILQALDDEFDK